MTKPLFTGSQWTEDTLASIHDACAEIAEDELGLDTYANDFQIITSEQMLDAYSSTGLPVMYNHWSFGKSFVISEQAYRTGRTGLAYELVINSNPCINYLMEENSAVTQALVIAHAGFGHNHVFKNNYMFKEWTDADGIVNYLVFAKNYIRKCEEREGIEVVEQFLDSVHALQGYGVDRYKRPKDLSHDQEIAREKERAEQRQREVNVLWDTVVPVSPEATKTVTELFPKEPEENLLKFIEKHGPNLKTWQREVIRIVRIIQQYFFPQMQTKVLNEGFAVWTHNYIINRLHDKGLLDDGAMLEFIQLNTNVLYQPGFDSPFYQGLNPYTLGYNIFRDIERICKDPTDEDREWFPDLIGENYIDAVKEAVANYRDESFVRQFLSPKVMRDMRMFSLGSHDDKSWVVNNIHNDQGYKDIRGALSDQYGLARQLPDIQVINANIKETRRLELLHMEVDGQELDEENTKLCLVHLRKLWGFDVTLFCVNSEYEVNAEFTVEES
jgi:spore cortex formation protein SpoVR/YcgB (stage V sporulation)